MWFVFLPNIEHLVNYDGKVKIGGKMGLKAIVGSLLEVASRIRDVIKDLERVVLLVVHIGVEDTIIVFVSIDKLISSCYTSILLMGCPIDKACM